MTHKLTRAEAIALTDAGVMPLSRYAEMVATGELEAVDAGGCAPPILCSPETSQRTRPPTPALGGADFLSASAPAPARSAVPCLASEENDRDQFTSRTAVQRTSPPSGCSAE